MTNVGKFLVIVILVMSFLVGGMVIVAFITSTNYKDAVAKRDNQMRVMDADRNAWKQRFEEAASEKAAGEKRLNESVAQLKADYQKAVEARNAAENQRKDEVARASKLNDTVVLLQAEQKRRSGEVQELQNILADRNDRVNKLTEERKLLSDRAQTAELNFANEKERNLHLIDQLQGANAELARMRASGGASSTSTTSSTVKNPPPEDVKGIIKAIDPASGYLTISIGSDHGIGKNNTLEVFRLSPRPAYLGTIRIVDVRAHEAIAKQVPSPTMRRPELKVGDEVASDILGRH